MTCPRCKRRQLVAPYPGHAWCVCGYSDEPDDVRDQVAEVEDAEGGRGRRGAHHKPKPWTEQERAAWNTSR